VSAVGGGFLTAKRGIQTTKNTKFHERMRVPPQARQTPISSLARQQDRAIQEVMNKVAGIRTAGSPFTLIHDQSCITPQTRLGVH
jgi:hypothetical protein